MTEPIKPNEITKAVPDAVIECFNALISERWTGNSAKFRQDEVVELIREKGISEDDIFNKRYLDIESLYRAAGWKVVFDKPGYNETYPATFEFTKGDTDR